MTPAFRLWRELAAEGVLLEAVGEGGLRFAGPKRALSEARKRLLKQHKQEILEFLKAGSLAESDDYSLMDSMARSAGWLVLHEGSAYSMQLSRAMTVFLLLDDDGTWRVWRGIWRQGEAAPFAEKTLGEGLNFAEALERGNSYVTWIRRHQGTSIR